MTPYVDDLFTAYKKIPQLYFNTAVIHSRGDDYIHHQKIERVVNAELYHQWRKIMDREFSPTYTGTKKYQNLILHSEIGKLLSDTESSKHPDLVLHGGQVGQFRGAPYNKVFVELKMDGYEENDINKGFLALCEPFHYEAWVYIIHNASLAAIRQIPQEVDRNWHGIRERMCFFNNTNGIIKLTDIIN